MSKKKWENQNGNKNKNGTAFSSTIETRDSGERLGEKISLKQGKKGQVTKRVSAQTEEAKRIVETMNNERDRECGLVKDLLNRTNGEFPKLERDFIEGYFFEESSEEVVRLMLCVSPERFWEIHDSVISKFRNMLPRLKHIYNA